MFNIRRQGEINIVSEYGLYNLVLSSQLQQPKIQAELSLMMAQTLVAQEKRIQELEEKAIAAHHRIDNFDKLDTIGDLQQR